MHILALTPSTHGFGYAVLDQDQHLVDWGVKRVLGKDKNRPSLAKSEQLMAHYLPSQLVMWKCAGTRRADRIKSLSAEIVTVADRRGIKVSLFSRQQVKSAFGLSEATTKHELAKAVVRLFPEELSQRLPPKRKLWMSEDVRLDIFDAVALAVKRSLVGKRNVVEGE